MTDRPDIILTTLNARYVHAALGLRYLAANMGELQSRTRIVEFVLGQRAFEIVEDLLALNPRIIMTRVSGYGQKGPYAKRSGYDRIALGFSGYMYPTGFPDRFPVRPAFPTADYNTGTFAALATMFALYARDAAGSGSGEGQLIDLGLYEAPFRITSDMMTQFARTGAIRERIGNRNPTFAPAGTFQIAVGRSSREFAATLDLLPRPGAR